MIVVHHLNESRSQRVLWLLKELGVPYEIRFYARDTTTRLAPPELKQVHPLGKSPVVEDDGANLIESGAIVDTLIRRHGGGRLRPAVSRVDCRSGVQIIGRPFDEASILRIGRAYENVTDFVNARPNLKTLGL